MSNENAQAYLQKKKVSELFEVCKKRHGRAQMYTPLSLESTHRVVIPPT